MQKFNYITIVTWTQAEWPMHKVIFNASADALMPQISTHIFYYYALTIFIVIVIYVHCCRRSNKKEIYNLNFIFNYAYIFISVFLYRKVVINASYSWFIEIHSQCCEKVAVPLTICLLLAWIDHSGATEEYLHLIELVINKALIKLSIFIYFAWL